MFSELFAEMCKKGQWEMVERERDRHDLLSVDHDGLTYLMWAAGRGQEHVVPLLIPGSDLLVGDAQGRTPLMYAIVDGNSGIVAALIPGSNVNQPDDAHPWLARHCSIAPFCGK